MVLRQASLLSHFIDPQQKSAMVMARRVLSRFPFTGAGDGGAEASDDLGWVALTKQEQDDFHANLDRWKEGEDDGVEDRMHFELYTQQEAQRIRRQHEMRRVRRFRFLKVQPAQDSAVAWQRVEVIDQVMELIFSGVELNDLGRAALVSRRWREAAKLEGAWSALCARDFPALVILKARLPGGVTWWHLVTARARACMLRPAPAQPKLSDFMIGVEVFSSDGPPLSLLEELKSDHCFLDYKMEGANVQEDGGIENYPVDVWEKIQHTKCEHHISISAFLVRKADHKIISLGDSDQNFWYNDDEMLESGDCGRWNVLAWEVPNHIVHGFPTSSSVSNSAGGKTFIKARFCTESRQEPVGCQCCDTAGARTALIYKVTGVELTFLDGTYHPDAEFLPEPRNQSVLALLDQIQKDLTDHQW
eukprot:COSAG01_NODE_8890_length_2625_cov_2.093032_1_plen_418_part_00